MGCAESSRGMLVGAVLDAADEWIPKIAKATIFKSCDKPLTVPSLTHPSGGAPGLIVSVVR